MFSVESLMFKVYRNERASLRGTKQSRFKIQDSRFKITPKSPKGDFCGNGILSLRGMKQSIILPMFRLLLLNPLKGTFTSVVLSKYCLLVLSISPFSGLGRSQWNVLTQLLTNLVKKHKIQQMEITICDIQFDITNCDFKTSIF